MNIILQIRMVNYNALSADWSLTIVFNVIIVIVYNVIVQMQSNSWVMTIRYAYLVAMI